MPIAFDISSTKGSQFFFWFIEASVEMTPNTTSLGVSAAATDMLHSNPMAASPACLKSDGIIAPLVLTGRSSMRLVPPLSSPARRLERQELAGVVGRILMRQ